MVEEEERFWPWSLQRWQNNTCSRGKDNCWQSGWLQTDYKDCPIQIEKMIIGHVQRSEMIPFRRREFEVDALLREVVRRASMDSSIRWGAQLPLDQHSLELRDSLPCAVMIICDHENKTGCRIQSELGKALRRVSPQLELVQTCDKAAHIVIVLTAGIMRPKGMASADVAEAIRCKPFNAITTVYLETGPSKWDWNLDGISGFEASLVKKIQDSIRSHEAYKYRPPAPGRLYEHLALAKDIAHRMPARQANMCASSKAATKVMEHTDKESGAPDKRPPLASVGLREDKMTSDPVC